MFAWDFEAAEGELRRAEALNPNGEYVLANLTAYYMLFGWPPERAIEYAHRGRDRDPLNPWAAIHVPQALWHAQQYGEALRELERVSEIDPNFWLTYFWKAMALTDLGRHAEALLAAQRALELNEDAETLRALAITHARAGELDQARAISARLNARGVRTSPGIHVALGDHEAALAALELDFSERDRWLPEYLHYPELCASSRRPN
jgi:tetratricopeptide (TPR) repeat protein